MSKPNAVRRGVNHHTMQRPAWFARGLTAGRLSLTVHSSASIKCDRVSGRFWLIVVGLEPGDLGVEFRD
jgi:hypothetical protein